MFKRKSPPKRQLPQKPTEYPSGLCVKTEKGYFYINGRFRHPFVSQRAVDSWNFTLVPETTEAALSHYLMRKMLGFREATVLADVSDGKVYIISNKKRRLISTPEAYDVLGITIDDALWVGKDEIEFHPEGGVFK
jgi:hypothetical protein